LPRPVGSELFVKLDGGIVLQVEEILDVPARDVEFVGKNACAETIDD
jgi:hypothetical protein